MGQESVAAIPTKTVDPEETSETSIKEIYVCFLENRSPIHIFREWFSIEQGT